jgi:putative transcriptional regulator
VNKKPVIAIPADRDDPEDRAVTVGSIEFGLLMRTLCVLRNRLGLSCAELTERDELPPAEYALWEWGRARPAPEVQAYLRVIGRELEVVARAMGFGVWSLEFGVWAGQDSMQTVPRVYEL